MEFMLDNANITELERCLEAFPITGVTSNPSILKAEGDVPFFETLRAIRELIGTERSLHVQVTAADAAGMVAEGHCIREKIGPEVFIKVPVNEEGLKAIRALKAEGAGITATAIYSKLQGFMAIAAGADLIAPYCNRMANIDVDFRASIAAFRQVIDENDAPTKILAASFHSVEQVNDALIAGAHAATVQPSLLHGAFAAGSIKEALDGFARDWMAIRGERTICELDA